MKNKFWGKAENNLILKYKNKDYKSEREKRDIERKLYDKFNLLLNLVLKRNPKKFNLFDVENDLVVDHACIMFEAIPKLDAKKNILSYLWRSTYTFLIYTAKQKARHLGKHVEYHDYNEYDKADEKINSEIRTPEPAYDNFSIDRLMLDRLMELVQEPHYKGKLDLTLKLSEEFGVPRLGVKRIFDSFVQKRAVCKRT